MLIGPQFSAAVAGRLAAVRERIALAAARAGRNPTDVTLVGVAKSQPAEAIVAARDAGLGDVGENYLQEALPKIAAVGRDGLQWHFIGQLQSNKTRAVAEHFDWVHTVDRLKLAERLSAQRPFHGPALQLCVQVNLDDEQAKGGIGPDELPALVDAIGGLPRVALRGLMCVPAPREEEAAQRRSFARLRELRDRLDASGRVLDVLSMGMSGDFEAAILEGATHVRIGTAIFGPRPAA